MSRLDDPEQLRAAIKSLKVARVAKQAKIKPTTLYSFVDGKTANLRGDTQAKVKKAIAELTLSETKEVSALEGIAIIPIYDIRASAGSGALVEDGAPTGYQPFREPEIARYNPTDLAVIQVGGDSMWETLHDGDKVLVNRAEKRIVKPGIYILAYEGTLIVKRCQRNLETGAVIVQSDNPDYETFTVTDADVLDVIGRVVWIGRALG